MNWRRSSQGSQRSSTSNSSAASRSLKLLQCKSLRNAPCNENGRRRVYIFAEQFVPIYRFERLMSILSSDQWQALSPLLDEALGMSEQELSPWLSSLRAGQPTLAD